MSQLDQKKLSEDARAYLLKANVEILRAEELMNRVRYDRIDLGREGTGVDKWYDPFQLVPRQTHRESINSYLDESQARILSKSFA